MKGVDNPIYTMRIFAISDLHIDFKENLTWLHQLSRDCYRGDLLLVGGDVCDDLSLFMEGLKILKSRFREIIFVPGNHDLWVHRNQAKDSIQKFYQIKAIAADLDVKMKPLHIGPVSIVPLLGWYDESFGRPCRELINSWVDYRACKWPFGWKEKEISAQFIRQNESCLTIRNQMVISVSHFLPRIDLMPAFIPEEQRKLYPVLGSSSLEEQIRHLNPTIHVYGHSHLNRQVVLDGITYINNAYGYPYEHHIAAKRLQCILEI
jgi:Icc-related predicted phosphoesterase